MTENVKKIAEILSADEKLQAELAEKLTGKGEKEQKELLIAFAKEKGFELEEADLEKSDEQYEGELDAEELAQVTGGKNDCFCIVGGNGKGKCPCPMLGGGEMPHCYCLVVGSGDL